jgi:2-oxoglutarate ferredoxin oxidoreductase subunit alpha
MMQVRWGSHGDYEVIAYAPSSPQEMFDLTVKAFNTSERFRTAVFVMADEIVGHMTERVIIPKEVEIISRKRPKEKKNYLPFLPDADLVPPMAVAGEGFRIHVTGLTHDERGYPAVDPQTQKGMLTRLIKKIQAHKDEIIEYEEYMIEEAEIVVVAYGSTARSSRKAICQAQKKGIKVGMLRLITCWPFPEEKIKELAERAVFIVPEVNFGQMAREVERFSKDVFRVSHPGGEILNPQDVFKAICEVA